MANTNVLLKAGDILTVTAEATPIPVNKLPLVAAGIDQSIKLPISEVTLKGEVSDSDGSVISLIWEKISGGLGTIATPTQSTTKVTGLALGSYMFRLTAIDDKGGSTSDDLKITVLPADVVIPPSGKVEYLKLPAHTGGFQSDTVIEKKFIANPAGVSARLTGIRNIKFIDCYFGPSGAEALTAENSNGILIQRCLFVRNAGAVYGLASSNISILDSQFVNTRMRTQGGRGQFFQANSCNIVLIQNCKGENFADESDPEDCVSFFRTNEATARGNMFRGGVSTRLKQKVVNGVPQVDSAGKPIMIPVSSVSGSGIMSGDNGGNNQLIENNVLLTTGNAGIGVAGGTNIRVLNNKIYSERNLVSNNPLYVWSQAGAGGSNVTVKGNRVHWIDKTGARNNGWNAGNMPNTVFEAPTDITLAEMGVPAHLIDMVTPTELLTIRK